ncbi:acyltransferase [Acetobacter sp. TBRC 12305]|uniref:Acyltransferase n=1 Tax=Acetobacter garciniae TaxID=2817435 RepID=A0A939HI20_9PROT|nr:acyltransferase [Acetobacter garciniae]MBO1324793.1 acyltransferase [Acetobacter garciniae]MBX0344484.1 acyltransferase [Acetobacter garciniae]
MTARGETWLAPERGNHAVMAIMLRLAGLLGRRRLSRLIWPISLYYLLSDGTTRRGSRTYLRRVLGREPSWRLIWRHIHSYALMTLDRLFILDDKVASPPMSIRGTDAVVAALDQGRGCILLGAHIGSFDALRSVVRASPRQLSLKILMYRQHTGDATRLIEALDPGYESILITLGQPDTMLRVAESLQAGDIVAILGDRAHDMGRSLPVSVLGRDAPLPTGPFRIAAITGAPVVLFSGLRCADGHYDIRFESLVDRLELKGPRAGQAGELRLWMQRYADWMSDLCRRHPLSWYNLYDFWKERS